MKLKTRIVDSSVRFINRDLSPPLQMSTGLITEITEARVSVTVAVDGKEATGTGAIYLSDLWSWPESNLAHSSKDQILRTCCEYCSRNLFEICGGEICHPLELGMRLHHGVVERTVPAEEQPSMLAKIMCASPFDAAIHDATGLATHRSAFEFYQGDFEFPSVDRYFGRPGGTAAAINQILRKPARQLEAWWIIGANDSIEKDVVPAIRRGGYRCFKMKLLGKDNRADVSQTIEVYRGVAGVGVENPRISLDSNEGNPDAGSVLEYLEKLQEVDPEAYKAVDYLEQPTSRDIYRNRFDWRSVTRLKPVLLDEGLTRPELFQEAYSQGWSGFGIKTCKGHSFALVAAAWAAQNGMRVSVQDLTNPGYAAIHAVLLAAHLPSINGVELNSPQFTPDANQEWLPRLDALFQPGDGYHQIPSPIPHGLGSRL